MIFNFKELKFSDIMLYFALLSTTTTPLYRKVRDRVKCARSERKTVYVRFIYQFRASKCNSSSYWFVAIGGWYGRIPQFSEWNTLLGALPATLFAFCGDFCCNGAMDASLYNFPSASRGMPLHTRDMNPCRQWRRAHE